MHLAPNLRHLDIVTGHLFAQISSAGMHQQPDQALLIGPGLNKMVPAAQGAELIASPVQILTYNRLSRSPVKDLISLLGAMPIKAGRNGAMDLS